MEKEELDHFFWKVDAGAEYAVTQPVFDTAQLGRMTEMFQPYLWIRGRARRRRGGKTPQEKAEPGQV